MRLKPLAAILTLAALGIAACGTGSSSSARSSSARLGSLHAAVIRIYRVRLTGAGETPRGARSGTGEAVIALHRGSLVCWRFAHLHGFIDATFAHIHVGAAGRSGNVVVALSTGPRLHHRGCVTVSPSVIEAIERDPPGYYVNVHSHRYPADAGRGQL